MVSKNATLWSDGTHRVTLRVTVHLDLDVVAAAVAMASNKDVATIVSASRKQLLEWARCGVEEYGLDHIFLTGGSDYPEEAQVATRRLVELGMFPAPDDGLELPT